tara:strand:+ start:205 stop:606 length:402 start_codon:yes stop_codon:yes gene_type:complete
MVDSAKEYTEKQKLFLEALYDQAGGDIRAAMRMAGYSDTTKMQTVVEGLKDEIIAQSELLLASNTPKATYSILNVLNDPAHLGARNVVSAAREILDRAGVVKREKIEVSGPESGLFILPPKQRDSEADEQRAE